MDDIVRIPIDHIHPHPANPRKDLGDLTELSASIMNSGILQNLTVVPMVLVDSDETIRIGDDHYVVIIGHRRRAAAELAGLTELPCVIADMDEQEQVATMLAENMQRSDLTKWEEGKGFQMMLDLGKSVADVSAVTGVSDTKIRQRLKLAKFPEKKVNRGFDRGATLFDFEELDAVEDPKQREELLNMIGTPDFKAALRRIKTEKQNRELLDTWCAQIDLWATKAEDRISGTPYNKLLVGGKEIPGIYVRNYGFWNQAHDPVIEKPADADKVEYLYLRCTSQIDLYKRMTPELEKEELARQAERQREVDENNKKRATFEEMSERHRALRREFIWNFDAYQKKDATVLEFIAESLIQTYREHRYDSEIGRMTRLAEFLGIPYDDSLKEMKYQDFMQMKAKNPDRVALLIAYFIMDEGSFYASGYRGGKYLVVYHENPKLEKCIKLLTYLGYNESMEETKLRRGSHELFDEE